MKISLKLSFIAFALLALCSSSFAQARKDKATKEQAPATTETAPVKPSRTRQPHPEMEAARKAEKEEFKKELGLTDAQADKLAEINKKYAAKRKDMKAGDKAARKQMQEERLAELKTVLDANQIEKLEAKMAEREAKRTEKRAENKAEKKAEKKGHRGGNKLKKERSGRAPAQEGADKQ